MLRKFGEAAQDLLYPKRCVNCGEFGMLLCEPCRDGMEPASGPGRCPHCRAQWDGSGNCPRCFGLQAIEGVLAAVEMSGAARQLVHALKYQYVRRAAGLMAGQMLSASEGRRFDALFPVPLHRSRQRERGFNQSQLLMQAAGWAQPPGSLRRTRNTSRQVGMHEGERRANVSGAFVYRGPLLNGLSVAIVDDVVTTGATVQECAIVLKDAGAREVWAVAFARASYKVGVPSVGIPD
ncbi:MAG: ComF family protein [Anaerolineaceae bacterium]